jgi:hypothetical protein
MKISSPVRTCSAALTAAVVLIAAPPGAATQTAPLSLGSGVWYQSYLMEAPSVTGVESISLLSVPFGARSPRLFGGAWIDLNGAFAQGNLQRSDGSTVSLAGVTDTQVRLNLPLSGERVVVSAGYLLPTGSSSHSWEQAELAGIIASDLLPFRVNSWGGGGALATSATFAIPVGAFGLGAALGYTVGQEFTPLQDESWTYRPANALRARAGADRVIGRSSKVSLILDFEVFGQDQIEGQEIFQSGNRYGAIGSYAFAAGERSTGLVFGGVEHRDVSSLSVGLPPLPAQNLLYGGSAFRVPVRGGILIPMVESRLVRRDDRTGAGVLSGAGVSFESVVGSFVLVPSARARFGTFTLWEGQTTPIRGFELGLGVRLPGGMR